MYHRWVNGIVYTIQRVELTTSASARSIEWIVAVSWNCLPHLTTHYGASQHAQRQTEGHTKRPNRQQQGVLLKVTKKVN